jgi:hypothetical protein
MRELLGFVHFELSVGQRWTNWYGYSSRFFVICLLSGPMRFTLSTSESPNPIRITRKDHQANRHTENHPHAIALDPYCV